MKKRVLFIDGEPEMHALVSEVLIPAGYDVEITEPKAGDVTPDDSFACDLVILDVQPENVVALQTIGAIKRKFPNLPILALTGSNRLTTNTSFMPITQVMGADRTLRKPFTGEMLLLAVRLLFGE